MGNQFFPAPDVERIGRELIREHHQHLLDHNVRVEFCFCSETPKKNGREVWGTAQKVSGKTAFLMLAAERHLMHYVPNSEQVNQLNEAFFLITIQSRFGIV